jgi:hypothetical protein
MPLPDQNNERRQTNITKPSGNKKNEMEESSEEDMGFETGSAMEMEKGVNNDDNMSEFGKGGAADMQS